MKPTTKAQTLCLHPSRPKPRTSSARVHTRALLPLALGGFLALLCWTTTTAQAQNASTVTDSTALSNITAGVDLPLPTLADRDDALSLELNPAGLAHIEGFEFHFVHSNVGQNGIQSPRYGRAQRGWVPG